MELSSFIETSPDAVLIVDPDKETIMEANAAASVLTGYTPAELNGLPMAEVHAQNPTDEKTVEGVISMASSTGRALCTETSITKKDGSSLPVDIFASRIETGGGRLIVCHVRDMSRAAAFEEVGRLRAFDLEQKVNERTVELKTSVRELRKSKKKVLALLADVERSKKEWEDTFDSIPDPIFIHDRELRLVKCNMAYQRLACMPFQKLIGRPYYEAFPLMEGPFRLCEREKEGYCRVEQEEIETGGETIYRLRYIPLRDGTGRFTRSLHIMEDITGEKRNLRRIEREMAVNERLLRIAEATSKTTNIDLLMKEIVSCVRDILSADMVAAYLGDGETKSFVPTCCEGVERVFMPLFKTSPIDGRSHVLVRALETGEAAVVTGSNRGEVNDVFHGNRFIEALEDLSTMAIIPITYRGAYLGIILVAYRGGARVMDERDMELMKGFAGQASVAIDEARLYRESINRTMDLSRKIMTIRILNEIDRSILSAPSVEEILETAARMLSRLVQCDGADVWTVKEDGRMVYAAGHGHTLARGGDSFDPSGTVFEKVLGDSMPFATGDTSKIEDPGGIEREFIKEGLHSVIIIPLAAKHEIKGLLNVYSRRVSAFGSEDLSTLEKFSAHIGVALENTRLINDLEGLFLGTVRALSKTIDAKSPWTRGHSERVTEIAIRIARTMGFGKKALKDLELAGLLHDIGKIATYEGILDKAGKLTDREYRQIQQHPVRGAEILSPLKQLRDIIPGIRYHHVWYDGRGYPAEGLSGKDLPAFARILAVADTIDAMSADRPYRKGRTIEEVVSELKRCSGTQFDPEVVRAFLSTMR